MLKETMDKISASEKAADRKQEKAQEQADSIVAQAKARAEKIQINSNRMIESARADLNLTETKEGESEKSLALAAAGEEIKSLREIASLKENEAVEAAIKIILENNTGK